MFPKGLPAVSGSQESPKPDQGHLLPDLPSGGLPLTRVSAESSQAWSLLPRLSARTMNPSASLRKKRALLRNGGLGQPARQGRRGQWRLDLTYNFIFHLAGILDELVHDALVAHRPGGGRQGWVQESPH